MRGHTAPCCFEFCGVCCGMEMMTKMNVLPSNLAPQGCHEDVTKGNCPSLGSLPLNHEELPLFSQHKQQEV